MAAACCLVARGELAVTYSDVVEHAYITSSGAVLASFVASIAQEFHDGRWDNALAQDNETCLYFSSMLIAPLAIVAAPVAIASMLGAAAVFGSAANTYSQSLLTPSRAGQTSRLLGLAAPLAAGSLSVAGMSALPTASAAIVQGLLRRASSVVCAEPVVTGSRLAVYAGIGGMFLGLVMCGEVARDRQALVGQAQAAAVCAGVATLIMQGPEVGFAGIKRETQLGANENLSAAQGLTCAAPQIPLLVPTLAAAALCCVGLPVLLALHFPASVWQRTDAPA